MDSGTKVQLYVELLNKYVYFYEKGVTAISTDNIEEILEKITEEIPNLEQGDEADQVNQHFLNTVIHMRTRQEGKEEPNYGGLVLPDIGGGSQKA